MEFFHSLIIGGSRGGVRDARPPRTSKFFRFHAVFGKIWRVHAPPGGFTPPPHSLIFLAISSQILHGIEINWTEWGRVSLAPPWIGSFKLHLCYSDSFAQKLLPGSLVSFLPLLFQRTLEYQSSFCKCDCCSCRL